MPQAEIAATPAELPGTNRDSGSALRRRVFSGDAVFATGESHVFAVYRVGGR